MITLVLILVSASCASVESAVDKAAVEEMVRGVLHELCPGANVCLGNQTTNGNQGTEFGSGETTCCTECSCEADCENRGNCCFQPETNISSSERNGPESVCIFPTTSQPLGENRIYYQSYRMISDVPQYDSLGNKMITAKCGDEKVAPWGAFFPVFSRKNKAIYKNSACARAADVTDGVTWDVQLSCKHYVNNFKNAKADAASFITGLFLDRVPNNCKIQFIYPGDSSDLASSTCFKDLIDTCSVRRFKIPKQLPLIGIDIKRACKSGLISPYRQSDMFANVFCHICNGLYFTTRATCEDLKTIRGIGSGELMNLIDGVFMSKVYHTPKKQQLVPLACPQEDEELDHCRKVFCPSGQLRDENGKCVFVIKKWFMQKCSVSIQLKADKSFSIHETFEISGSIVQGNISPLVHAWPKNWIISAVSFEAGIKDKTLKNALIVEMLNISPSHDPDVLLENIQRGLKLPWSLKLRNNTLIPMTADWVYLPHEFHSNTLNMKKNHIAGANNTLPAYIYLYTMPVIDKGTPFPITRLYFCDQIQLESSEYDWYEDNLVLLNKITNKTLFPGEFTTIFTEHKVTLEEKLPARVCLRDSGFIERKREDRVSGAGSAHIMVNKFLAFSCLIIDILMRI